jgi:putative membrane protein
MGLIVRLAVSALALWLSTLVFKGITVTGTTGRQVLTIVLVAAIFGIINAVLRPIIKTIGCWAYLLTLGLISLVVNGALLLLTSYVADKINLPFHVDKFWPTAVLGALFIGVVSWIINLVIPDGKDKDRKSRRQPPPPPPGYGGGYQNGRGYQGGGYQGGYDDGNYQQGGGYYRR